LQEKEPDLEGKIRLISVSNEQKYHGYPKLVKGLYDYYKKNGKRKIEINFIGEFRTETKKLVNSLNLENYIHFLGKKYGNELNTLYNKADLGIGALASRAGSEYGSSIKTKEYFALGLPFINGWKEYAFDDSYPYVKRFDLNNEKIDFEEVVRFYDSIKNDKKMQIEMRKFAEKNYTWKSQFEKIFRTVNSNMNRE
jgi:glycosyltransferase involved in cell wall biosynthesis